MYDIEPFVPKIRVEYPDKTVDFPTLQDYIKANLNQSTFYYFLNQKVTKSNPYFLCTVCNLQHLKKESFSPKCFVEHTVIDYEATKASTNYHWNYYKYKKIIIENTKGHHIVPIVRLRNELGDPIELPESITDKQKLYNRAEYKYNSWITGENSPNFRGLLPAERHRIEAETSKYGWYHKYRHAIANRPASSYYRQIKTFNERKQYAASQVDKNSLRVRAKRTASGLPNNWDDYFPHYDKSWKNKKIRKQWMINLK